jgi:DNA topoisomerase I
LSLGTPYEPFHSRVVEFEDSAGLPASSGGKEGLVARLKRVDCSQPGIARRRRGRGFEYLDVAGRRVESEEVLARIRELAIPPGWTEVWICPNPNGHLQVTGIDDAGRKQYLYHPRWRARRDQQKFEEMLDFARTLPRLRRVIRTDLAGEDLGRRQVLACALRLLDRGFFRIGSEDYAEQNDSYGLATILSSHVAIEPHGVRFDYVAKSGQRRIQKIDDPDVLRIVTKLKRRRGGGDELLAYKERGRWVDVTSADINEYVKEAMGEDFSAKDFRTWNGTMLAAVALSTDARNGSGRRGAGRPTKRAITEAVKVVAGFLGNTPAVARASYIDPRVFDRYLSGWTIAPALQEGKDAFGLERESTRELIEKAVVELIEEPRSAPRVEKLA